MSMIVETTRDKAQWEAVEKVLNNKKGIVLLPTGYGKTRVGIMLCEEILKINPQAKILIITSRNLLVKQWEKETNGKAEVFCINTGYKIKGEYDLLIVDEAHRSLSPTFGKLYDNVKSEYLLLLTATLPHSEEAKTKMLSLAPIVMKKTVEQALEDDAISDFQIFNVPLQFDKTSGSRYKLFSNKLKSASIELYRLKKKHNLTGNSPFDISKSNRGNEIKEVEQASKAFWGAMTMRKQAVFANSSKIDACLTIINKFKGKKWLVLFKSIEEAKKLNKLIPYSVIYHSKMSGKEREQSLNMVRTGKADILIGVDALNEGLDIPLLDAAICASGDSSPLVFIQSVGRVIRKREGKKAMFVNLYAESSREEEWVKNKTNGTVSFKIKLEDLCNLAEETVM